MTFFDFQRQAAQGLLAQKAGQPSNIVYYNLQEERRLSAEALARPGSVTDQLKRQRQLTDEAVTKFQALSGETADSAPTDARNAVAEARRALGRLAEQRSAVDRSAVDQQTVYAYYTDLIAVDLRLFTALSHVANGEVTWISKTLVNAFWAKEMLAREDAILARGWPSGKLSTADYQLLQQAIGAQDHLFTVQVVPYVPADEQGAWQQLANSPAWQAKATVEQALIRPATVDAGGSVKLPQLQDQWRQALDQVNPALVKAIETRTEGVVEVGKGSIISLLTRVALTAVIGLFAVVAVVLTSWRLTRSLRRRIKELQSQAQELERTLPEVVERLSQGEQVDVEAESRAITAGPHSNGTDELAQLGQALNLARTSALETSVRQAEQYRGFERLLQRIARRTQLLIGQQLRKLDELERKHEDPEVLEGLFDLDHLTARLRRYEENLVILAGGQPQRKWRKPVPLLDVLRSAQGEVQDYRRIMLDVEGHPWLSERAVGPVAHVVAELMENAATFSKPPTPVDVRAAVVGRGLAIEIEDRGLGMDPDQYDAANALMTSPPRMDVLARADDIRLGFYVVARLAASTGIRVEFRPSAFGGTRVVVLVPGELVIDGDADLPDAVPVEPIPLARRQRGAHGNAVLASVTEMPALSTAPTVPTAGPVVLVDEDEEGRAAIEAAFGDSVDTATTAPTAAGPSDGPGEAAPADQGAFPQAGGYPEQGGYPEGRGYSGGKTFTDDDVPPDTDWFTGNPRPEPAEAFALVEYVTPAEAEQPVEHGSPGYQAPAYGGPGYDGTPAHGSPAHAGAPEAALPPYDAPAYPDIAYATVTPAEAPYADEQYRPADHYRLAERRERREYDSAIPLSAPETGQPPLPQRVRQASLAAELRVPPQPRADHGATAGGQADAPGLVGQGGQDGAAGPFQRPPRRSGATIGAFQRQSRAARGQGPDPDGTGPEHPDSPAPPTHAGPPTPAPGPSPWALPAADPRTTRTEDQ
ncbi:nitrate- and nitrite sensing domain-containing protein [Streptomyces sp. BE20]|uniref:sensor histidine kinase n=1 Tax=Streptomyces sp. BE20 TaxID=3002525 RepID=UPI002E79C3B7|nr:nitrate- and nitrite sensing domain-containing protein [Streptomyces sp. BE20]MEE1822734.1 nitrate- and nitrite sensing domain-containing protein [Streptomyces sp. BE20]